MEGGVIKKKVNLLGEPRVGKTSLVFRFVKNMFGDEYIQTLGTNVYTKKVHITGSEVKMVIHDIMGQTDHLGVRDDAFYKSAGAIAVADITRKETLEDLVDNWLPNYREAATDNAPVFLAINKVDLEEQEMTEKVLSNFHSVFYTSTKTGEKVERMFNELGFATKYCKASIPTEEEGIVKKWTKIDEPKRLMFALITHASEVGGMPFSAKEKMFEWSGIDISSPEKEVSGEEALSFGGGLIDWYERNDEEEAASAVKRLLEKYQEDSGERGNLSTGIKREEMEEEKEKILDRREKLKSRNEELKEKKEELSSRLEEVKEKEEALEEKISEEGFEKEKMKKLIWVYMLLEEGLSKEEISDQINLDMEAVEEYTAIIDESKAELED
ncbi:MAG: GTP-binding protein [Candidatus Thermoplasmatota archaeon]|nr:GTP-binding protein [Candidatus Thermoplasmatota archaeon]